MSSGESLDALLFAEDDASDNVSDEVNSAPLGTLAQVATTASMMVPPPASVSTLSPPMTSASSGGKQLVQVMFSSLKKKLAPHVYEQLKTQMQLVKHDQKNMMQTIKQIAGDEIFKQVMLEIRSIGSMNKAATPVPMPPATTPIAMPAMLEAPPVSAPPAPNPASSSLGAFEKLLVHAASCSIPPPGCPTPRCADIKKMVDHAPSCANRAQCVSCSKLAQLVKYHSKICTVPKTTSCPVIFCNKLLRPTLGMSSNSVPAVPLKPPVTDPGTMGVDAPKKSPEQNQIEIYGEILQLILHAQKCNVASCSVGSKCSQSKALIQQMNDPNAPSRAKAYKTVFDHYMGCKKKDSGTCQVCKRGLQPIATAGTKRPSPGMESQSAPKKAKTATKSKAAFRSRQSSSELANVASGDLRKEGDALTHTAVDLTEEKKKLLLGARPSLAPKYRRELDALNSRKEMKSNLFDVKTLHNRVQEIARQNGVSAPNEVTQFMARAVQDYVRQVLEDLVLCSQYRCNAEISAVAQSTRSFLKLSREVSATATLHAMYDQDFAMVQQRDRELRQTLLVQAENEETADKERQKKRKKSDKKTAAPGEEDERAMDVSELAQKDLKNRMKSDRKLGSMEAIGGVNTSVPQPHQDITVRNRITMADAAYYLTHTMPPVRSKIQCRADAAMILTKSLM